MTKAQEIKKANEKREEALLCLLVESWRNEKKFLDSDKGKKVMQTQLEWVAEMLELLVDSGSFISLDFPLAVMEAEDLKSCMDVLEKTVIVSPETKGYEHLTCPIYAKDHFFSVNFVCAWALVRFPAARVEIDSFVQYLREQRFHITDNNFEVDPSKNYPPEPYDVVLAEVLGDYFYKYLKEDFNNERSEKKKFVHYFKETIVPNQMFMVIPEYKEYLEKVKTEINKGSLY